MIYDGWLIAKNYFFGRFWIDFFSTIQFDMIIKIVLPGLLEGDSSAEKYQIISCLKLFRVLRLGRLINYLNSSDDFK